MCRSFCRDAFCLSAWLILSLAANCNAQSDDATQDLYTKQIKPVLRERCFACHGALKQEAGLRLDTYASLESGGDNGPAISVAAPLMSQLLLRITATDESERMPPQGESLTSAQIDSIRQWLLSGAAHPQDEVPETDPRQHWSFQRPVKAEVPRVKNALWQNNPIDAFLAREHETHGLVAQAPAPKSIWLRRVSLDLIGLPPTTDELTEFEADESADAYERVVDRLLQSPHYGERWGRHWMDLWRYSDAWGLGAEVRNSQKHMWHWRDWIIESLNNDKGYDQMLREMIAADELYPDDLDRLRASGYLARQYFKFNRTSWLDETIEHTSKAMMGLTMNCSKCHDHKYDPISQTEYYRFRAIFEPYQIRTDMLAGTTDLQADGLPRAFDCNLDAQTFLHIRGDDRRPDTSQAIVPELPEFLKWQSFQIEPVALPATAYEPGLRSYVLENYLRAADADVVQRKQHLEQATSKYASLSTASLDTGESSVSSAEWNLHRARVELATKSLATAECIRSSLPVRAAADAAKAESSTSADDISKRVTAAAIASRQLERCRADEELSRATLAVLEATSDKKSEAEQKVAAARVALAAAEKQIDAPGESYLPVRGSEKTAENNLETDESRLKPFPRTSTGRRTALANWLCDPKNPLTARVAVNHIWARHFGRPLVPTLFDFGRHGTPPSHPQLLDWLAVELMEHNWSMQHLHRLIVSSQAYRMSSSAAKNQSTQLDPENRWYWRMNANRMQAQIVRDSLLSLAGEMDLRLGGPSVPVNDATSRRRSLYFIHSHNEHNSFLSMFDDASVLDCYRRAESIVPQQALALENSQLASELAELIAKRIAIKIDPAVTNVDEHQFVSQAFRTILAFEPNDSEVRLAKQALATWTAAAIRRGDTNSADVARTQLVRALINHNDFITIR